MKVVPTDLHIWKVWLNSFIEASASSEWYLHVLAPTVSRAAKVAGAWLKQWQKSDDVVVGVEFVCHSIILEPTVVTKYCVKSEEERKEETQWQKDLDTLRAKSK